AIPANIEIRIDVTPGHGAMDLNKREAEPHNQQESNVFHCKNAPPDPALRTRFLWFRQYLPLKQPTPILPRRAMA
ncbi:MAG: hypothetical protein P8X52_06450, partial [Limibacillus sp.]